MNVIAKKAFLIKQLCSLIIKTKNTEPLQQIYSILSTDELDTKNIVQMAKIDLLGIFVFIIRESKDKEYRMNEDIKLILMKIVATALSQNQLDHKEILLFHNLFGSLIQEVYILETSSLKNVSEELMSAVLNCLKLLFEAVTDELCPILYTKENAMRICKMIFVVSELLKHRSKKLKANAIDCLMSVFRVNFYNDYNELMNNIPMAQLIADCFSYFLPGIALGLGGVILEGSIVGGRILELTIEAMGKIMTLLLKDYEEKPNSLEDAKALVIKHLHFQAESEKEKSTDKREAFFEMQRNWKWFQTSDKHLVSIFKNFTYLTDHHQSTVKLKLAEMCNLLIKHCLRNIPLSARPLIEMLVIMSDSTDDLVATRSKEIFDEPILGERVKQIISEDFHQTFSRIPAIFNGIDSVQKVIILKLTAHSLKLIGNKFKCNQSFKEFQRILLYLCEAEIGGANILEVGPYGHFEESPQIDDGLWKGFKHMQEDNVRREFNHLCQVIYEVDLFPVLSDYLINILPQEEEKVETIYLMNQLLDGVNKGKVSTQGLIDLIMPTFETYNEYWEIPLEIDPDGFECTTLKTVKTNVLQAALMCEGIGKMAQHAKGDEDLRPFLFDTIYKVLVRAASNHHMIRAAAIKALQDMASGLGFVNISQMIMDNMDFFLFYVERGLKKNNNTNNDVFEVMETVMEYGDFNVLERFSKWVNDVLIMSFDRYKQGRIDSYLKVFRMFLRRLIKWYNVEFHKTLEYKTWKEKNERPRNFEVNGVDNEEVEDFSDDVMGKKDAYEMYLEDVKKKMESKVEDDEYLNPKDEPYEKPTPPKHISITVEILKRSLNFLPSKDIERKLKVLEILRNGIEIIKDYEDELLPIVHQIWSPLVHRFNEKNNPVILQYSFLLLVTMAGTSKDFIRNRTSKDVLPNILSHLSTLSKDNKKETSKFSLNYKLQLVILENLFSLIHDVELLEEDIDAILKVVVVYVNEARQPDGLKAVTQNFLSCLKNYNPVLSDKIDVYLT